MIGYSEADLSALKSQLAELKSKHLDFKNAAEKLTPSKQKQTTINGLSVTVSLRDNKIGLGFLNIEQCEQFYNSLP